MRWRRVIDMRRRIVLLGVGGVGKTTFVYRLLGLSVAPHATLRPGLYRLYLANGVVELLDVPGQHAAEVAQRAARHAAQFFDRAVLMYDVTRADTLYALGEILDALCIYGSCLFAKEVLAVGNKLDLAKELGYMVENNFLPHPTAYISALCDPPEKLAKIIR
jgi:GTPase SAR1 family protein